MTSPFDSLSPKARQLMEDFDIFALAEIAASGSANPSVQGRCPACHGQSLFLGEGGYVTCSRIDCPDPEAATRILEQRIDYTKIREIGVGLEAAYLAEVMRGIDTWEPVGIAEALAALPDGTESSCSATRPPTPLERALDILNPYLRDQPLYREETP
ncbi:DUF6085 family protein [Streptomyces sp. NPDC059385]|uniref:DUF6085 family protein n=1 Tax=Streptomyces sp. NPDC059385 TaxID=3346817 RepID=UPI003677E373